MENPHYDKNEPIDNDDKTWMDDPTTVVGDLSPLRSAIIDLARAYNWCTELDTVSLSITETLTASAEKGETDPHLIAARIQDILRETEQRLGMKLTKGGNE